MSKPSTVLVTAAAGRLCPIAAIDATAPGGRLLYVKPGDEVELPNSSYVRRRIAAGDLVEIVKKASAASSSSSAGKTANTKEEG